MRVLQVLPELNVGGVETGTVDFAKYLIEHGHCAIVVSNGGALAGSLEKTGATHYSLPVHKKSLWTIVKSVKALRKIILEEKVDIVHARSRVPGWIAYFACRHTQAEFITTCHGYYENRLFSRVMGWGKFVIVPSDVIGRHMVEKYKVSSEHIRPIPRSVDLSKFKIPHKSSKGQSSDYVISMVGRITPLKGHTYFLKAMAKVVRSMPYAKIWIIGDAPRKKETYKQELQVLVRHLGLSDHVEFLGNRQDIPQLLSKTDVLVMSSVTPESFGRVILEAQAAGVPVVATQVGGVVEIIDHEETGLLVLPKDTDQMAQAVSRLFNDRKLVQQLTVAAKEKLQSKFLLEHMASRTIEVYQEALSSFNILVIKLSSVGDVVLVTASLKALRKKYPKAKIYCLVGKESRKILQKCACLDGLIVADLRGRDKGLRGLMRISYNLAKYHFDKVIDFQNNTKSHLLAFLSFPKKSYGYKNKKLGCLLTETVENPVHNIPPVSHQFQVLSLLGIEMKKDVALELWLSQTDKKYVQELLDSEWLGTTKNIVGINLAASEKWATKNWPIEHAAKMCDILATHNIRVVITGMDKDREAVRQLKKLTKSKPASFAGKTDVMQLAALIKRCEVFITPDSAPMHIAAAVKTPFVVLFGPTDSQRHLPPASKYVVFERNLSCAPCYSSQCRVFTHACMKDISPEEVAEQVLRFIEEKQETDKTVSI
ncbi:MAG: lipopolysaccharide heptosyltransferase II [Candidatus Omnitrophica bacterium]|nr:lipopolysaccharide heptosyltransferase II [Candidatus Omnitrophota bacterium]